MSIEALLRAAVREEVRTVLRELREELRAALAETSTANDGYLSIGTAAAFAEIHPDTLRSWVKAGHLGAHHAGRELRVRRSELERYMATARTTTDKGRSVEEEAAQALTRARR